MNNRPTPETDALECAFALLKCSPIGNPENSSEYGRAAYILSEHCQGKEDVSEAAMRIFAKRIADLERERDEAMAKYAAEATEHMLAVNKLAGERDKERKELEEVRAERDILRLDAQREAEHHDRMVGELEKTYRERDEAREVASGLAKQADRLRKERDEARNKMADVLQEVDLRTLDYLRLREAVIVTLEENRHLADGDDCTLAKLKSVVQDWK